MKRVYGLHELKTGRQRKSQQYSYDLCSALEAVKCNSSFVPVLASLKVRNFISQVWMYSKLYNENSKFGKTKVLKAALSGTWKS